MSENKGTIKWADLTDSDEDEDITPHRKKSGMDQEVEPMNEDDRKIETPDLERKPMPERKTGQTKEEMLKEIDNYHPKKKIRFNIVNMHFEATEQEIREYYKDINIIGIFPSQKIKGMFDLKVDSKEEAIKFVEQGSGRIRGRPFYIRLSYVNNWEPTSANYPAKQHKSRGYQSQDGGEDSPNGKRYKKKKQYYENQPEQPDYDSPYNKKKPSQVAVYHVKTHRNDGGQEEEVKEEGQNQNSKFQAPASPIKFYNAKKNRDKEDGNTPMNKDDPSSLSNFDPTPVTTPQPGGGIYQFDSETKLEGDHTPTQGKSSSYKGQKRDQPLYKPPQKRENPAKPQYRNVYVEKNGISDSSNYNSPNITPMQSQEELKEKPTEGSNPQYYKKKFEKAYDKFDKFDKEYDRNNEQYEQGNNNQYGGNNQYNRPNKQYPNNQYENRPDKPYENRSDKPYENRGDKPYENRAEKPYAPKKSYQKTFDQKLSYVPKTETPDRETKQSSLTEIKMPSLGSIEKKRTTEQPKPNKKANIFQALQ